MNIEQMGPGKYDAECTAARLSAGGSVALIVIGGKRGGGFSVQGVPGVVRDLPEILRIMADAIELQIKGADDAKSSSR